MKYIKYSISIGILIPVKRNIISYKNDKLWFESLLEDTTISGIKKKRQPYLVHNDF